MNTNESWFIPIDIITCIFVLLGVILVMIYLLIIIFDRTCHTVPMLLVGNSCLIGFLFGINLCSLSLTTLIKDIYLRFESDRWCSINAYIGYSTCSNFNISFLLQAIYRYVRVVHPNHLAYQSIKFQLVLIILTWISSFLYHVKYFFSDEIIYNSDNQVCQLPLRLTFSMFYMSIYTYFAPVSLTFFIYLRLVLYVRKMSQRITPVNTLLRAKNELQMLQRTTILVMLLIIYCFPYAVFMFWSFFTSPPKYSFRIAYAFIYPSYFIAMVILFQFTDPLKTSIKKRFLRTQNIVIPTTTR